MSDFYGHLLSRDGLENEGLTPYRQLDQVSAAMVVDAEGARFLDEGLGGIYMSNRIAALDDPSATFTVFDWSIWEEGPGVKSIYPANPTVGKADGMVLRADSLAELAGKIGADPEPLTKTVDADNAAVRSGNRTAATPPRTDGAEPATPLDAPPFMAITLAVGITTTMGGLLVDANMQLRDANDQPMPDLYATGGTTSGLEGGGALGYVGGLIKVTTKGLIAAEATSRT